MSKRRAAFLTLGCKVNQYETDAMEEILEKNGYSVDTVEDGITALDYLRTVKYDGVILDVMMPKLDGYGVAEEVRKMSDVPIIMLTAKSDEKDELRGFDLGIDEYITKPFSPRILVARVEAVHRRTQADAEANVINVDGHQQI